MGGKHIDYLCPHLSSFIKNITYKKYSGFCSIHDGEKNRNIFYGLIIKTTRENEATENLPIFLISYTPK
jgi:hypothetical protein